jgi:hypothetical protein
MEKESAKKERVGIDLPIYPDFKGGRVTRYFGLTDEYRFDIQVPVPKTDEECQSLYGVPLATIIAKGAKQHSYDNDTNLRNLVKEAVEKGETFASIEDVSTYAVTLQDDMSTPKERKTSAAAQNKKDAEELKRFKEEAGVESMDELRELIAKAKANKAKK